MFVVNFKLDFKKILIFCIVVSLIVVTIVEFGSSSRISSVNSNSDTYDYVITEENYIASLKLIHENIDQNLGKTIKISGYVFRMPDFKDEYFVCGRDTIVDGQDIVAGILCTCENSNKLLDNEWVEVTGVIIKGEYNGVRPIIKVGNIEKITAPANTFVQENSAENT